MFDYDNLLAIGFALGVWRGLIESDDMVDDAIGAERRGGRPSEFFDNFTAKVLLATAWLVIAALSSDSFRGFLHIAAMPAGLYLLAKTLIMGGTMALLAVPWIGRMNPATLRKLATVIGLILFVGSCVPMSLTDPCNDADAYCEEPDWL